MLCLYRTTFTEHFVAEPTTLQKIYSTVASRRPRNKLKFVLHYLSGRHRDLLFQKKQDTILFYEFIEQIELIFFR